MFGCSCLAIIVVVVVTVVRFFNHLQVTSSFAQSWSAMMIWLEEEVTMGAISRIPILADTCTSQYFHTSSVQRGFV